MKIATHDSATGEKGKGFLSWLLTPFAKTQGKTIKEQYEAGCRMFDIRVRLIDGEWRCAHGPWHTKRTAEDILTGIARFKEECYVTLTYEGSKDNLYAFTEFVSYIMQKCERIHWGGVAVKYGQGSSLLKVQYEYLLPYPPKWPCSVQAFLPLDGKTWHILLPIPWLWKKIYHNKAEFDNKVYRFVDFL